MQRRFNAQKSKWYDLRPIQLLFCWILLACSPLFAQQRELKTEAVEGLDAVLLVDASGSMLLTDPTKLRYEGARLFMQALKGDDRLAIVSFAAEASVIRPLSTLSADQLPQVTETVNKIEAAGDYTDIYSGIMAARAQFEQNPREGARQIIILLSDGKMDPNPSLSSSELRTRELIDNVLPEVKSKDIKIYTLYFSDLADKDLLAQIAAASDGLNWFTPSADKIHESYTNLFLAVKKPQILPLTSKGFHIDQNVQEATFYINREEGSEPEIISPAGKRISAAASTENVKWFRSQKFDVITIISPEVGDWQIQGLSSQEGFATVLTNLKLVTDWSSSVYSGSKYLLQARLYEADKPIVLPEMTGAANYAYQISPTDRVSEPIIREFLVDDGSKGDKIARDGIFSSEISIDEAGEYKLEILLKAPTFERRQQVPFKVKPRFVSLRVEEVEVRPSVADNHGEEHAEATSGKQSYFVAELSPESAGFSKLQVALKAIDHERKRFDLKPVMRSKDKSLEYRVPASVLPEEGKYKIQAFVNGESKKSDLNEESNILEYDHHAVHAEELPIEHEVEEPVAHEPIWWPHVILVILVNVGVGFALLQSLRKSQTQIAFALPQFSSLDEVRKSLEALQAATQLTEIDLNDARLAKDYVPPKLAEISGSRAATAPDSAPAPTSEAQPAPEQNAQSAEQPEAGAQESGEENNAEQVAAENEVPAEEQPKEEQP